MCAISATKLIWIMLRAPIDVVSHDVNMKLAMTLIL